MRRLGDQVALVAGASRGAGRGIALALAEAGATVYVAGRTVRGGPKPSDGAPGTIDDVAEEAVARGGRAVAVQADLTSEEQTAALVERIAQDEGRLDVLACAVWGGNETGLEGFGKPFWELGDDEWAGTFEAGVHAYLRVARHAGRVMARGDGGLIALVSDGLDLEYFDEIYWDLSHQAIDRMAFAMGREGARKNISAVSLKPGFMRTERVLMSLKTEEDKQQFGFDQSESVEYIGRVIAALTADPQRARWTGRTLFVADLAQEYGVVDIDGRWIPRFDPSKAGTPDPKSADQASNGTTDA